MKKIDLISPSLFLVICTFLIFSTFANTQLNLIKKLDLDLDGQISIKEAVADPNVLNMFGHIDTDGNGKISPKELSQAKVNIIANPNAK